MRALVFVAILGAAVVLAGGPAPAQTFSSGSTGADGVFNPATDITVPLPPDGVFHFTTVSIPSGVTVRFARNAANTPVTILAAGDVTIAGTIDVSGAAGGQILGATAVGSDAGAGGPGGFDGGAGANGIVATQGGAGGGPGGGTGGDPVGATVQAGGGGGGFGGPGAPGAAGAPGGAAYSHPQLAPLIGGSGGGGGGARFAGQPNGGTGGGGGGGGGALVIASSQTITLGGAILARGGNGGGTIVGSSAPGGGGGGSGGAVRLIATRVAGAGAISVLGGAPGAGAGAGGPGRIRVEAFTTSGAAFDFNGVAPSIAEPTSVTLPDAPTLQIVSVGGVAAPPTPSASFASPDVTLPASTTNPVSVDIAGTNIPPGTTVTVRVQGQVGGVSTTTATLSGTEAATTATASVTIPTDQPSVLSATVSFTLVASAGQGPWLIAGEPVERVQVTAGFGGRGQVAYLTRSGRAFVLPPR